MTVMNHICFLTPEIFNVSYILSLFSLQPLLVACNLLILEIKGFI